MKFYRKKSLKLAWWPHLYYYLNEQIRQIKNLDETFTQQSSIISLLQNNLEVLDEHCSKLQKDIRGGSRTAATSKVELNS